MKKTFVEPKMRKIELNLSENIAESQSVVEIGFIFWYHWTECTVQSSGMLLNQGPSNDLLWACFADGSESTNFRGRTVVPEEVVRMNLGY